MLSGQLVLDFTATVFFAVLPSFYCGTVRRIRQTVQVVPAGYTTSHTVVLRPEDFKVKGLVPMRGGSASSGWIPLAPQGRSSNNVNSVSIVIPQHGISGSGWVPFGQVQGSMVRTLNNGTKICDCWDVRSGSHPHGSVWNSGGAWKLMCNNGTNDVLACLTNNGQEVPVNSTVTIDGFWRKCIDNGATVRYTEEPSCNVNGKKIHMNDTFPTDTFIMKCEEWGYSIAGCVYFDSNNVRRELAVGQKFEEEKWRHSCMPIPEVQGRVKYEKVALGCTYNGQYYKKGQTWIAKNMNHICNDYGSYKVTNCLTDDGKVIPIGETLIVNNIVHKCYSVFNTVYYEAYSCGTSGAFCQGGVVQPRNTGGGNGISFVIPQGRGNQERVFHKNNAGVYNGGIIFGKQCC